MSEMTASAGSATKTVESPRFEQHLDQATDEVFSTMMGVAWLARSQALDLAAGNLANAGTAGYRAERDYFRSVILGPDALGSQLNTTVNAFGVLGGSRLDFGQGALTSTGNSVEF